ncbi:cytochrome P450, partial [Lasiosphaeria miniovina]
AEQAVASRLAAPDSEKDARDKLGAFLRRGVTRRECEIEVPFQIIAGSDTTATAIRATLLFLASSRAYGRLQQEIDVAAAESRISSPVTADEGEKMEYLQAVTYEGLRMQIPFSGLVMKEVPPGGDTINGLFVPGGTRVAHNTLAMQRRRDIFSDDVDVFRPERWLNADPVSRQRMVQTTELVFGHGRWGCVGISGKACRLPRAQQYIRRGCVPFSENCRLQVGGIANRRLRQPIVASPVRLPNHQPQAALARNEPQYVFLVSAVDESNGALSLGMKWAFQIS